MTEDNAGALLFCPLRMVVGVKIPQKLSYRFGGGLLIN